MEHELLSGAPELVWIPACPCPPVTSFDVFSSIIVTFPVLQSLGYESSARVLCHCQVFVFNRGA